MTTETETKPSTSGIPRRNVAELTATIEEMQTGDLVVAGFKSKRYGYFKIKGVAIRSADKKSLIVGSWMISTDKKPMQRLVTLSIMAKKGEHDLDIVPGSEETEDYGSV